MVSTRICTRCLEPRPVEWFARRSASRDGLGYWCRECRRVWQNDFRHRDTNAMLDAPLPEPNPIPEQDQAWLAGLMDGEGSIGVQKNGTGLTCAIQLSMTCGRTVEHAGALMTAIGAPALSYSYNERNTEKHKPFHYLRVGRLAECRILAVSIAPFAITKQEHWELMEEFTTSRLEGRKLNIDGKATGGRTYKLLTPRDWEIYERLRELNRRGPHAWSVEF